MTLIVYTIQPVVKPVDNRLYRVYKFWNFWGKSRVVRNGFENVDSRTLENLLSEKNK